MLLFSFDVFPAFDALGLLKGEQRQLWIVVSKWILETLLSLRSSLLTHCGHLWLCHRDVSLLSNVLMLCRHLSQVGLMLSWKLVGHVEDRCDYCGQTG